MDADRSKKIFLMRVGVIALAVLVLVLWSFNLRGVWRSSMEIAAQTEDQDWQDLKADLNRTMDEVSERLDELKETENDQTSSTTSNSLAIETAGQDLLSDLIKKTEQLATSSPAVATSSDSLHGLPDCPVYINCMPTIDDVPHPCIIPTGCEGITEIVY